MRAKSATTPPAANDMRWTALDLVCTVRHVLGLRDRDIATLRGLLSLIGPEGWQGPMMVHASNKVLQERCDGADERSLRRRLTKLIEAGLIRRRQSPNRKRYVLRDETGAALIAYGFDLTPLRDALPQLREMAAESEREAERVRVLRGLLRHRLYEVTVLKDTTPATDDIITEARLALRRTIGADMLQTLLTALGKTTLSQEVTDGDSQTDRHIESTRQESYSEPVVEISMMHQKSDNVIAEKMSLGQCLSRLGKARSFIHNLPQSWNDLSHLGQDIGRSLGLSPAQITLAVERMGPNGASLAIMGLLEAQDRVRNLPAYFNRIIRDAARASFSPLRMFHALTRC